MKRYRIQYKYPTTGRSMFSPWYHAVIEAHDMHEAFAIARGAIGQQVSIAVTGWQPV